MVNTTKLLKLSTDALLILYELDLSPLGVIEILRFCNHAGPENEPIRFNNQDYLPIPLQADNFGLSTNNAEESPTLTVTDVNQLVSAILQLVSGDLGGAKLKRFRVFASNLDDGIDPDPSAAFPSSTYTVDSHIRNGLNYTFNLDSPLTLTNTKIPRQKLRAVIEANTA